MFRRETDWLAHQRYTGYICMSELTLSSRLGGGVSKALMEVTTGPSSVHTTMLSLVPSNNNSKQQQPREQQQKANTFDHVRKTASSKSCFALRVRTNRRNAMRCDGATNLLMNSWLAVWGSFSFFVWRHFKLKKSIVYSSFLEGGRHFLFLPCKPCKSFIENLF